MRRTITSETWEQIFTGYAAGVGLREIARKMNVPVGTVLAHAKRHGWTQQIQRATRQLAVMQSDAITPLQPVPQSIAAILSEHKERSKLGLSKFAALAAEQAAEHPDKLGIASKVKDVAKVHSVLWSNEEGRSLIEGSILIGEARPTVNLEEIESAKLFGFEIVRETSRRGRMDYPAQVIEVLEEPRDAQPACALPPPASPPAPEEEKEIAGEASRRAYRERCTNWRRYAR
jgi:hypothetical protein